jgi:hypothetical protein
MMTGERSGRIDAMSNDNDIRSFLAHDEILYLAPGSPTHFEMDESFCARMRAAIEAGLLTRSIREDPHVRAASFTAPAKDLKLI